jgi:NCS1 family nucleobase:cation symporter-1
MLGPVAGVMIADYWLVRRRELSMPDLYRTDGIYRYASGFNPRALIALAVGIGVSLAGRWFEPLRLLADLGWTTGFLVGGAVYGALAFIGSRDR